MARRSRKSAPLRSGGSWWLRASAGLPAGPLWLWASPRSGVLWPWSVALLALRSRVRRLWWRWLPRCIRVRVRWHHWWHLAPPWVRWVRFALLPVLLARLAPVLLGLLCLWLLAHALAWLGVRGLLPRGRLSW